MNESDVTKNTLSERLARLEERMHRIEEHLHLISESPHTAASGEHALLVEEAETQPDMLREEELEFEVGQTLFAKIGMVVLAVGVAFLLSLPFEDLPAGVPALIGYVVVGALFVISHLWRSSFELVSKYLRGAAMLLLYFATLRLYFFGPVPVLTTDSFIGAVLLVLAVAVNLTIAMKRQSPYLVSLSLITGSVTAVVVGFPWFVFPAVLMIAAVAVYTRLKYDWPGLLLVGITLTYLTHLVWAINNPFLDRELRFVQEPLMGVYVLLVYAMLLASGSFLRKQRESEDFLTNVSAVLNAGGCYAVFLLHTLFAFESIFTLSHTLASAAFLAIGITFWVREKSRISTFVYAMTGYTALSVAIIQSVDVPNVFVWLSLQSIVVITTAVWFRSRFIVVANFVIFVAVVIGYMAAAQQESGISIGFGIVALLSARILGWQKDRLELRTEKMRNAYLISAFVVFPYSLFHIVPTAIISLSWVGIALFYYAMNLFIRSPKYRWMGHGTLLLTVLYVVVIGIIQLQGTFRILSFLVLGIALLVVSLIFTRLRARKKETTAT